MIYYLAIKRKEVLIHATMWMNHENMINEGNQSQGPHIISLSKYQMPRIG